ncbi:hypothetical protein ACFP1Z_14880 [Streptomyces gamaensis]|uniref:Uncharacterized protein n=1 Tax=Streptomyces gamaensis TaxID=1763542 RepID=A0ABW0YXW0_9ACTN
MPQAQVLSLTESQKLESISLNRLPHGLSNSVDWERHVDFEQLTYGNEEEGVQLLKSLLSRHAYKNTTLAIFWGTLVIPSVLLPSNLAIEHADEILGTDCDFWIFSPEEGFFAEVLQDGQVTITEIPQAS